MARSSDSPRFSFGGRIVWPVGLLLTLTVVASLVGALGARHGAPLFAWLSLEPERILHGEIYRLVTWVFCEPSPLGLLIGCFILYWCAKDLAEVWSARKILASYAGITAATGAITCAIALVDPAVRVSTYLGMWPLGAALIVAWGMFFPDRTVLLFFVIRVRAIILAWLTMAVTVVYAVYSGWEGYVPELVAMAVMLGWIFRRYLARRISNLALARRAAKAAADRERALAARRAAAAATTSTVKRLDSLDDDEPPPMPREVEAVLDRILDETHREGQARRLKNRS